MAGTTFSTTLQSLRKQKGVTQEQLATHLGVSPQAVSKWENGSYPDGDLLPQIADYFEVSIDYLYGRASEKVSLEQQIMDDIKSKNRGENYTHEEHFEQMFKNAWAMTMGFWDENKNYFDRMSSDSEDVLASTIIDEAGFSYMRMNKNLEWFSMMKCPENGFSSYLKVTDELANLFKFLGDKNHLKILFYLFSIGSSEGVSVATIAKRVNLPEKTVEDAMEYLKTIANGEANRFLHAIDTLDEHDKKKQIYMVNKQTSSSVLLLLAGADTILNPPASHAISSCFTGKAWFKRENLDFLKSAE